MQMPTVLSRRPPRRPRSEWVELVQPLRAEGKNISEVARALGISNSFASGLISDPDGSKDRARKQQYLASCVDCEEPCDPTATRCMSCQLAWQREQKYWTRERVLDAIRRFAAANGRPPTAREWVRADYENDYPPLSQVYRSSAAHLSSPFASWADAIEAAGFERPTYAYPRTGEVGLGPVARVGLALAEERGHVTATILGEAVGTARQNAYRTLETLVWRGLLTAQRVRGGRGRTNRYEPVEA